MLKVTLGLLNIKEMFSSNSSDFGNCTFFSFSFFFFKLRTVSVTMYRVTSRKSCTFKTESVLSVF